MKSLYKTFGVVVSAALAAVTASCGDNGVNCGEGTKAVDGSCVPDGTVVCTGGTRFNAEKGTCEVDPTACQDGTVLVNNKCQDPAVVTPDATEVAEPNDDVSPIAAGRITVPAVGGKGFVIKGCITPHRDVEQDQDGNVVGDGVLDADLDPWIVSVAGPTLLDVKSDGVRGLVAGYVLISNDTELQDASFQRQAVSVVNDQANREIFLPKAGSYVLFMADSRTILKTDVGPGDANTCYYTTISQKALPAATAVTAAKTAADYDGTVDVYSYTVREGDMVKTTAEPQSLKVYSGLVAMKNDAYALSSVETDQTYATVLNGGLKATDTLKVIFDADVVYSGRKVNYSLYSDAFKVQPLSLTGANMTFANGDGTFNAPRIPSDRNEASFAYFDVAADGEIDFMDFTAPAEFFNYTIFDSSLNPVATGTVSALGDLGSDTASLDADSDWFRFAKAGRYYVGVYAPGVTGNFVVASKVTKATPSTITYGTPATAVALGNGTANSAFATLSVAANTKLWSATTAASSNFVGDVQVRSYAQTVAGRFDVDFTSNQDSTFLKNGTTTKGFIIGGAALNQLVRVSDVTNSAINTKTFDFKIVDRVFNDLGTATAGTPINRATETVPANGVARYFLKAAKGSLVTVVATPVAFNLAAASLKANEAVITLADVVATPTGAETLRISSVDGWVAFEIRNPGNATGTFALNINTITPAPFTEICPSSGGTGTLLTQTADGASGGPVGDESFTAAQTLAFNFPLFGNNVTSFKVSSNGWLSFDPALTNDARFSNGILPGAGKGFIAPYWDDLENIEVCRLNNTDKVTIEWKGNTYPGLFTPAVPVRFSVTLYSSGQVDFTYASTHQGNGSSATVGLSNLAANAGSQLSRNTAGSVTANSAAALLAQ